MSKPAYTRSKGQVLHRFEPGSVATIPVGTIEIKRHFARRVDNIGRKLQDVVRQELYRWEHKDAQMKAFEIHTAECVFVITQSVNGKKLDVRECAKCGAIRSMRRWRNDNDDAPCHRCQHPTLNEIPFVFAHADGTMIPLNPSACPQHDLKYLVLERGATKRWRCKVDGCSHAALIVRPLPAQSIMKRTDVAEAVEKRTGKSPSPMMTLTNVSDNKLQVVHSISRINLTANAEKFFSYPESLETLLAIHLNYFDELDKNIDELTEMIRVLGQGTQEDQKELNQLIQTLKLSGLDDAKIQTILEKNKEVKESDAGGPIVGQLRQALKKIPQKTKDLLGDVEAEKQARDRRESLTKTQDNAIYLREQLSDYAVILDLQRESLDEAVTRLGHINSPFCNHLSEAGNLMKKSLGINQVMVIQDLPVLHIAYGYTRLSHQPEAAVLWAFDRKNFDLAGDEPDGNWIPMPIYKLNTEALLFQFDARRIVKWLHTNNLAPDPTNITEPRLWLLEHHSRVTSRSGPAFNDNLSPDFLVPWLVSSALHSANHLLIKAIADQSSFGETALSEHLLLSLNQTIIFVNRLQEFSLGGLKTFFEQRLDQAFKSLLEERGDCMFDPDCEERLGGACAGCLHLPEVVCRLFNNALSRILLYGGEVSADMEGIEKTLWRNLHSVIGREQFIGLWDSTLD